MTTIDRLLISVLVAVMASTAVRLTPADRLDDNSVQVAATIVDPTGVVDPATMFGFHGFEPELEAFVRGRIELFDEAGLDLPAIRFVNCEDSSDCLGRQGMVIHHAEGAEVRLCDDEVGPWLEWVVIHELAHVWDKYQLTDEARQAFLDLRGLKTWRDAPWHERGAEHAAEIMVWGLIDRPVRPGHIDHNSCDELLAGYETLTGQPPLHGFCDICP